MPDVTGAPPAVTVAVKLTVAPNAAGLKLDVTVVLDARWPTTWLGLAELDAECRCTQVAGGHRVGAPTDARRGECCHAGD